ncbi:THUMP domain-containing protein 1 [Liparis tanakae]|uniref:THUMP domain-containing protein 1 n=1 Tax=Liparis tanakae TaxID=230148 RepID=A0A4Z2EE85_9TELE|nr:THUMP domain-containing protein 1 [Liparis tanakae]
MSAPSNDARKRGKKRYGGGGQGKRWKGSRELEVGMKGILITCNMNERKCTAEAFNLLNEYADELFGPEKVSSGALCRPRPLVCVLLQARPVLIT